jgi:hypothetical protein
MTNRFRDVLPPGLAGPSPNQLLSLGVPKRYERMAPDENTLESFFESLGPEAVCHLVSMPHPYGLRQEDGLAAARWLTRGTLTSNRSREITIVLTLVALGLAAALAILTIISAIWPPNTASRGMVGGGEAVQKSVPALRSTVEDSVNLRSSITD